MIIFWLLQMYAFSFTIVLVYIILIVDGRRTVIESAVPASNDQSKNTNIFKRLAPRKLATIHHHEYTKDEEPEIYGIRVMDEYPINSNVLRIEGNLFHLVGKYLEDISKAWFSSQGHCMNMKDDSKSLNVFLEKNPHPSVEFTRNAIFNLTPGDETFYHLCVESDNILINESTQPWRRFVKATSKPLESGLYMPLYIQIPIIIVCACLSSLFSGLNVGLMSLSVGSLELIIKYDNRQKKHAEAILPIRKEANFLLCTLLIGNTFVNNAMTLLLSNIMEEYLHFDSIATFAISIALPAIIIVIIGEIVPQAICCRYGLLIGAKTIYLTVFFMVLTFPLSRPLSFVLDYFIGVDGPETLDNAMIKQIVEMNVAPGKGISRTTANLVFGTMAFHTSKAADVMTKIEKVYMLSDKAIIDDKLLKTLHRRGHTRIPIYRGANTNDIIAIINVKDLVLIDPKCELTIGTVVQVWQRSRQFRIVLEDFAVSQLMLEMKRGHPLSLVVRFSPELRDYEVVGVVALEDIIEQITGDILDEKDAKPRNKHIALMA